MYNIIIIFNLQLHIKKQKEKNIKINYKISLFTLLLRF